MLHDFKAQGSSNESTLTQCKTSCYLWGLHKFKNLPYLSNSSMMTFLRRSSTSLSDFAIGFSVTPFWSVCILVSSLRSAAYNTTFPRQITRKHHRDPRDRSDFQYLSLCVTEMPVTRIMHLCQAPLFWSGVHSPSLLSMRHHHFGIRKREEEGVRRKEEVLTRKSFFFFTWVSLGCGRHHWISAGQAKSPTQQI